MFPWTKNSVRLVLSAGDCHNSDHERQQEACLDRRVELPLPPKIEEGDPRQHRGRKEPRPPTAEREEEETAWREKDEKLEQVEQLPRELSA